MARTPEAKTENPEIPPGSVISAILFRLTRKDKISQFRHNLKSLQGQIAQAPGIVCHDVQELGLDSTQHVFISVWTNKESMKSFRNSGYHRRVMEQIQTIADIFPTYWTGYGFPNLKEIQEKLQHATTRRRPRY